MKTITLQCPSARCRHLKTIASHSLSSVLAGFTCEACGSKQLPSVFPEPPAIPYTVVRPDYGLPMAA